MKYLIVAISLSLVGCEAQSLVTGQKEKKATVQKDSSTDRDQGKGNDDKTPKASKDTEVTEVATTEVAVVEVKPSPTPTLTAAQNACPFYHAISSGSQAQDSLRSEYRCEYADQINNTRETDYAFYTDGTGYINDHYQPFRRFEYLIEVSTCTVRIKINGTWSLELQSPYLNASKELELVQQLTISVNAKEALRCRLYTSPRN